FEKMVAGRLPRHYEADLPLIHQKLDLIGVNYYSQWRVTHKPDEPVLQSAGVPAWSEEAPSSVSQSSFYRGKELPRVSKRGVPLTPHGWEILPEGLLETLRWARRRYGEHEFYITENGLGGN